MRRALIRARAILRPRRSKLHSRVRSLKMLEGSFKNNVDE